MRKLLILALAASLVACASDDDDDTSDTGAVAGPASDIVRGQGQDVGSRIATLFTETGNEPQPQDCNMSATNYRFDERILPGSEWQYLSEVMRPNFKSTQNVVSTVQSIEEGRLILNNKMAFQYDNSMTADWPESSLVEPSPGTNTGAGATDPNAGSGAEEAAPGATPGEMENQPAMGPGGFDVEFISETNIRSNQPRTVYRPVNEEADRNLDMAQDMMESNCVFRVRRSEPVENHFGTFKLAGGMDLPAIHKVLRAEGSWVCRNENGQITHQDNNVTRQMDTISTYAIPSMMAFNRCEAIPIYEYMKIMNQEEFVLESSRHELVLYKAGQEQPEGGVGPGTGAEGEAGAGGETGEAGSGSGGEGAGSGTGTEPGAGAGNGTGAGTSPGTGTGGM